MDDVAYLTIPAEHVGSLTSTVLGLYGARAEALGASAQAFLEGADELVEVEHARRELRAVEDTLADLGWPDPSRREPVEIVGPSPLLRELTRTALLDAADGVVETVSRYEAGGEELPAVRRAVDAVSALFDLFATFEGGRAPALDTEA
ncbi:MAG: hypothetical protein V7607_4664 [Solirubrobacteraceae bacterium]